MLHTYTHALMYLVMAVRNSLMLLALAVACVALVTALWAKQRQARQRATQPQAKILQFRPRAAIVEVDEERRAA